VSFLHLDICLSTSENFSSAAQQQAPPPFTKTTKYNDLPEQAQKMFESIEYVAFDGSGMMMVLKIYSVHLSKGAFKLVKI